MFTVALEKSADNVFSLRKPKNHGYHHYSLAFQARMMKNACMKESKFLHGSPFLACAFALFTFRHHYRLFLSTIGHTFSFQEEFSHESTRDSVQFMITHSFM